MSDEEIKLDLQQQRFEKAIAKELETTAEIIKKTGVFNQIDKLYGDIESTEAEGGEEAEAGLPGDETTTPPPPMGGEGGAPPPPPTPPADEGGEGAPPPPAAESYNVEKDLPLILEHKGIDLPNIEEMTKKTNREIDKLNKEIDNLVKE